MEVYEAINEIIYKKQISKTSFVQRLIETEVKLKSTGNTPSKSTIYAYLNGTREIPLELIPIISKILNVKVEDLFISNESNSNEIDEFLDLIKYAPETFLVAVNDILYDYKNLYNKSIKKLK